MVAEIKGETVRIVSELPTVDIKSKQPQPQNSGNIILNPPTAVLGQLKG